MRFDLYTSDDRAAAARQYYLQEEKGRYWTWVGVGSYFFATFLITIMLLGLPETFVFKKGIDTLQVNERIETKLQNKVLYKIKQILLNRDNELDKGDKIIGMIQYTIVAPMLLLGESYSLLVIWGILFASFMLASRISIKFIAFYQGIVYGFISGIISFIITWLICYGLDIGKELIIALIVGIIFFVMIFLACFNGAALPAAR